MLLKQKKMPYSKCFFVKHTLQNVLEYALQETGMGGLNAIWQYWSNNVLDYAIKLQQEDQRLMADYEKLT